MVLAKMCVRCFKSYPPSLLLQLPAVTVEVSADKVGSALFVTILPYVEGSAPYCIKNLSSTHSVRFRQKYVGGKLKCGWIVGFVKLCIWWWCGSVESSS